MTIHNETIISTISGAISGAITSPDSEEALRHADLYYESIRNRLPTEADTIARRTGFTVNQILLIRNYLFIQEHELDTGYHRFDSSFEIAQSWQRLSDPNLEIKPHDITLLNHELLEMRYIRQGMTQEAAHLLASEEHDYTTESINYYSSLTGDFDGSNSTNQNSGGIRRLSLYTH